MPAAGGAARGEAANRADDADDARSITSSYDMISDIFKYDELRF
jgi:hypothetical protein